MHGTSGRGQVYGYLEVGVVSFWSEGNDIDPCTGNLKVKQQSIVIIVPSVEPEDIVIKRQVITLSQ